jgi:dihydroflavonol-4-reductase
MKAFVTGGTGFVGRHVVRRLIERGYDVTCLVRRPETAADLQKLGATLVKGDITAPESMRQGMAGADVVLHIAAWCELGLTHIAAERMARVNIDGTENVLGMAVELGVPRIVYTSTMAALGDTHSAVVDETYHRDSPFQSAYDRTKYWAHQVAQRYIDQGAPVVIVMPSAVYGPGDPHPMATLIRLMLRRRLPVVPGADTGFTAAYVEDVAEGHILAAAKGAIGESYILGGDMLTVGDALQIIARMAGVPAPLLFLGSDVMHPLRPVASWLEQRFPLPAPLSSEMMRTLGCTWMVTSAKAERELGYTHRSIEEGMAETISWEAAQLRKQALPGPTHQGSAASIALVATLLVISVILLRGRRDRT